MDFDAQGMAKRAELKAGLEEVAGRKLNMTDEQLLGIMWPLSSSTYLAKHEADDDAWITSEGVILPPIALDSALLDTSGLTVTGPDGQIVFRLGVFGAYQRRGFNTYSEPVNLVATPQGTSPLLMTMNHKLIYDEIYHINTDVKITACSWNLDGTPAANVHFYWRCRVPTVETKFHMNEGRGSTASVG